MIKAVIFDLDGTLVDTILDLQTAINCMLIRLGYKTKTKADVLNAINKGSRELVRKCLPKEVQDVEFILESNHLSITESLQSLSEYLLGSNLSIFA